MKSFLNRKSVLLAAWIALSTGPGLSAEDQPPLPATGLQAPKVEPLSTFLQGQQSSSSAEYVDSRTRVTAAAPPYSDELVSQKERQFDRIRQKLLYLVIDRSASHAPAVPPAPVPVLLDQPGTPDSPVGRMPQERHPAERTVQAPPAPAPELNHVEVQTTPAEDRKGQQDSPRPFSPGSTSISRLPVTPEITSALAPEPVPVNDDTNPQSDSEILAEPIDRLGLADSLFATNAIALALKTYEAIPPESLSVQDSLWVTYQIACCHRRQGDISTASLKYKELLENTESGWLGELARWWLETLDSRQAVLSAETQLTEALQKLEPAHADTNAKQE